jgi:beta propeller repeat protein
MCVVLLLLTCPAALGDFQPFLISDNCLDFPRPDVSGDIVVWHSNRARPIMERRGDIYGYDLTRQIEFPIHVDMSSAEGQTNPAISGDIVVWEDYRNGTPGPFGNEGNSDIYAYDLATQTEFPICTLPSAQYVPDVSGNIVVWCDMRNGNADIYGYDLSSGQEFPICTAGASQSSPAASGNYVVWRDFRGGGDYDIYGYDLVAQTEFPVHTGPGHQVRPAVSGDVVVWQDGLSLAGPVRLYGRDLGTGAEFRVGTGESQWLPDIDGDLVVWADFGGAIYGFDLGKWVEFPIFQGRRPQDPAVSGLLVVWEEGLNHIYGAYVPEPGAGLLLAAGALLACRGRRRRPRPPA